RRRRPAPRRGVWLAVLLLVGVAIGAAVVAWLAHSGWSIQVRPQFPRSTPESSRVHESSQFNYRFALPGEPWQSDDATRVAIKANLLVLRRSNPDAWVALAAREYKGRMPRDGENVEEAVRRLRGYFNESLEYESAGDAQLADRPA